MKLRNWRIGTRLAIGFGGILAFTAAAIVAATSLSVGSRASLAGQMQASAVQAARLNELNVAFAQAAIALRDAALLPESAGAARASGPAMRELERVASARDTLAALLVSDDQRALFAQLAQAERGMRAAYQDWTRQEPGESEAVRALAARLALSGKQASAAFDGLAAAQTHAREALLATSAVDEQRQIVGVGVLCALVLTLGALLSWRLTLSITAPLQAAVSIAKRVAIGDLSSQSAVVGNDEVSELLHALKGMNDQLVKIVGEVRLGTDWIATASREIATGNADLAVRTEAQASTLEETAASMEQLTATVKHNADRAKASNQLVLSSSEVAQRGGKIVRDVLGTMEQIKGSSHQIVEIISVIDAIAFQTNILALNAAVEAARAGEDGRGFAVVAAEVRNLAQRSAAAAQQIKGLITSSVERIEAGDRLTAEAGKTMDEIVSSVGGVTALMGEIAYASEEQRVGIDAINKAVVQMDAMTQQNAALVEQASAAAESMQSRAASLEQAVGVFRLESNTQEAVAMVERAAHFLREQGRDAALAAFTRPDPQFKNRDLYINVNDMSGTTLAHGDNSKLIGKNMMNLKDADGKLFIREFVRLAKSKGKGWVDYRWRNPVTGVIEAKSTYVLKSQDLVLACGIYK